jgi:very-short-patch-repair endonuclease
LLHLSLKFWINAMLNPKKTKNQRRFLRKNMTKWEVRLWNDLKGKKMFGLKIRRQFGVDNFIIDFYCPELKLAIEVDGDVHHFSDKKKADKAKDDYMNELGIKMVRVQNSDFDEDYETVLKYLERVFKDRAKEFGLEIIDE